jgi:isoamylase
MAENERKGSAGNPLVYEVDDLEVRRGRPLPLGVTHSRDGINFAVFSKHATNVCLVLFEPGADRPAASFDLDPRLNRTGDIWHALVTGIRSGVEYGYVMDRDEEDYQHLHRYAPSQVLLDPYAQIITGGEAWGYLPVQGQCLAPIKRRRGLVPDDDFDWGDDQPLNIPMSETVIYELHVRGFTQHPSSRAAHPGTYAGLAERIPYLKDLGVTAVELLPVNEFEEADTDRQNPRTGERLLNYWGYNSIGFFAPNSSYAADPRPGGQRREFKAMVRAFHAAGIEVILDVVFNHTAEGDQRGPTFCYRGIDNQVYYIIDPDTGVYANYSGCGNTVNCNHPVTRELILDALRYWVTEMHVDGFRFDLASILGRGRNGEVLANPPLLEWIAADPALAATKVIAEAWDAAGLYQVGSFPAWGRWAEWNGKFRDDVRKFVKSEMGLVPALAARLLGSPDVYQCSGRAPTHSVNFITCHDGFTLRDLVSYDGKHNDENGEDNRDGANDNNSWNCGWEGPTPPLAQASDALKPKIIEIEALRARQAKNLATLLILARGVPMFVAGDEFGRTQRGNNNAYCQDNDISWLDWDLARENAGLLRFFRLLIRLRKNHMAFKFAGYSEPDTPDPCPVVFHGLAPFAPDWSESSRILAVQFTEHAGPFPGITDIYLAINAHWESHTFTLPDLSHDRRFHLVIDTNLPSPDDISEPWLDRPLLDPHTYLLAPRSVVVLMSK